MEEEQVLNQWDAYEAQHLGLVAQFDVTLMDIYTYPIIQCQKVAETIGELEKGKKHVDGVSRKYKFKIKDVVDPPIHAVACIINNYKYYKKK